MHLPHLRPANLPRAVFHMSGGMAALAVIELLGTRPLLIAAAGSVVVAAWTMETTRRLDPRINDLLMTLFGAVAHPHERDKVNSATWYATALFILALFMPVAACAVAVVVLGFGDPMAAIIGRRFGRHKLVQGRSLEGSAAFLVSAAVTAFAALTIFHPEIGSVEALALAGVGAFTGMLAELFAKRVDDNFAIPLVSAVGAALVMMLV